MAKKEQQKGHGNQKNSGGRAGSVAANIESTERGRAAVRNTNKQKERHRNEERANGTFHARVNGDRSNDLFAALRGEPGLYAYPGGNTPSFHFSVQKEVGRQGSMSVIRLESIQLGHELEGAVFNPSTYAPCFYVEKFGEHFRSRLEDRLQAATQELIVHSLARFAGTVSEAEVMEDQQEDLFAEASRSATEMLKGVPGLYLVEKEEGDVVFQVFNYKKVNIKVVASRNPAVEVSRAWVPLHCLFQPTLEKITDDSTYEKQFSLFMFIRTALGAVIEKMATAHVEKTEPANLTHADREALAAAQARRERKVKQKFQKQRQEQDAAMALFAIQGNCVSAFQIASGKLGYLDIKSSSGELIVGFHFSGNDRIARVEHIGESHVLKLAGIVKGDQIFASAILRGKADRRDFTCDAEFRKSSILASHIREQMESRGVRFRQRQPA